MDSASAPPEPGAFGRSLAHRMTPQVTVIRRAVVQPGFIARRSIAFGSYVGQSQVSRWSIGATMSRGAMAVRPPIDYWPWASTEEPEPVAVPRLDRSLPRAKLLRRSGQPDPGAIVKAMRPEPIDLATRGQAKAPKRNDMQSFKAMLERTGRIPSGDGDAAVDDRPRGTAAVPPGRDRGAATARPSTPARTASPAAPPRATAPSNTASPRAARTAPAPAPAAAGSVAAGRPGSTPPRPLRPNPFEHDDEPGPTLRRMPADTAPSAAAVAPSPSGAAPVAASPVAASPVEPADRSLELPVSPVWPGAIESSAVTATPPSISARRAAEQLRSARGPRPLPAVISPTVEQVAPRAWSTTDTIDAGELAQQLMARRAPAAAPAPSSAATAAGRGDTATPHDTPTPHDTTTPHDTAEVGRQTAPAAGSAPIHIDAATAPVAPAGVQRIETTADEHRVDAVRRSPDTTRPTANAPTPAASTSSPAPAAAASSATTGLAARAVQPTAPASAVLAAAARASTGTTDADVMRQAAPMAVAPPATVAPPALLVQRSAPTGSSLLLPAGEAAAPPRSDTRERARQLPAASTAAAPSTAAASPSNVTPGGTPSEPAAPVAREASFSDRTQRMLARPLSPQPPDLAMPSPSESATTTAAGLGAVRPGGFASQADDRTAAVAGGNQPPHAPSAPSAEPMVQRAALPSQRETATAPRAAEHPLDNASAAAARAPRPVPPTRPTPDRFLQVLHATPAPAPKRLPTRFATLARSIAGDAAVQLRHDDGARAALAAVGKRAATIGNTILLDSAPTSAAATTVLAHELTHVANPTMAPRFYDDERQTVEERRADAVAQLIQRSPSLLAAPPAGAPLGSTSQSLASAASAAGLSAPATPPANAATVRRSLDRSLPPPPPQQATALASASPAVRPLVPIGAPAGRSSANSASTTGSPRAATVRRATASTASRAAAAGSADAVIRRSAAADVAPATVRRALTDGDAGGADSGQSNNSPQDQSALPPMIEALHSTGGQLDFVDWIVEQVEDRVVAEFQRRGGRFREDF